MSFEKDARNNKKELKKVDISILRFFWESHPILKRRGDNLVEFIKKIDVFHNFSGLELLFLIKGLHYRRFSKGEVVFRENDIGVGFYLISKGGVDIEVETTTSISREKTSRKVISLKRNDYFGELALLQEEHIRSASAIANSPCELYGILRPDLDVLINERPAVAVKLLQAISLIISNRLYSLTSEFKKLEVKMKKLEESSVQS